MRDCGCADRGQHKASCPLRKPYTPRPPKPRECGCPPTGGHRKTCAHFKPFTTRVQEASATRIARSVDRDALWDVRRALLAMAEAARDEYARLTALADRVGRLIANTDGDPLINQAVRGEVRRIGRGLA